MSRFDNVDLGNQQTQERLISAERKKRNGVLEEAATVAEQDGHFDTAERIRACFSG